VEVTCGAERASMRLIVAPDRAYLPSDLRAAGVAVSLYGVRSRNVRKSWTPRDG
jgi:hypothetical protein